MSEIMVSPRIAASGANYASPRGKWGGASRRICRGQLAAAVDAEVSAAALKRVLAWQLDQAMKKEGVTKNEMAKRMRTSRSQLERILDPDNDKTQLDTVFKAARVLGREVRLQLV